MPPDAWNYLGLAAITAAIVYVFWSRKPPSSPPLLGVPSLLAAAPSISRALDDLKHQHADLIIGTKLGTHQAATLSAALADAPKPPGA